MALFFILLSFTVILIFYRSLPPIIPLYYSEPWGEKQLANNYLLMIFPIVSIVVLVANLFFSKISRHPLLSSLLLWISVVFSFLSFFSLLNIILLVK